MSNSCSLKNECDKFILADGATTGFSGGRYAFALARSFMGTPQRTPWRERLKLARTQFSSQFDYSKLNWFQRKNFLRGSSSTILTGEIVDAGLLLTAVGDTCAFLIEKTSFTIKYAFPVPCGYDFATHPYLLGSNHEDWLFEPKWRRICWRNAILSKNKTIGCWLLCATDAIAEYVFKHYNETETTKRIIAAISGNRSFAEWINKLRNDGAIRVDDSTAVLVDME